MIIILTNCQDQDGRQLIKECTKQSRSSREQSKIKCPSLLLIINKKNQSAENIMLYDSYFRSLADMYFQLKLDSLRSCADDLAIK